MSKKLESIQSLRGIAVLLVVFYHIFEYEKKLGFDSQVTSSFYKVGAAGVDIFFVISGFVMFYIGSKKKESCSSFLLNRAVRIYPLYWVYTSVVVVIFFIAPQLFTRSGGVDDVSFLKSFLLLPSNGAPILGQGWTLIYEMYFYLIFGFCLLLRKQSIRNAALIMWFILLCVAYVMEITNASFDPGFVHDVLGVVLSPLSIEFLVGCFLAWLYLRWDYQYSLLVLIASISMFVYVGANLEESFMRERVLCYGIPSMLLVYGIVGLCQNREFGRIMTVLSKIGDASYSIYLSHILVLSAVVFASKRLSFNSNFSIVIVLVMLALSLIIGDLSYKIIERKLIFPVSKKFKYIINQRKI